MKIPERLNKEEETYTQAVYELVHYIYLSDPAVRESEQLIETYLLSDEATTPSELILENLELKGNAIRAFLNNLKGKANLQ